MIIRVCTGWHPAGSIQYGRRFLDSFHRHWPSGVELFAWVERPEKMPRQACRDLWSIEGARELHDRLMASRIYQGREPAPGWKSKCVREGYNFRFDAAKFWKQILIPQASTIGMDDDDILIWFDGDVEFTAPVEPSRIVDWLLDADLAFLGREPKHSEIGFWAVRINDRTRRFLELMADYYRSGGFESLGEWHSAYVWDRARIRCRLEEHNLCRPGASGHVWPQTELAQFSRHDKGRRKPRG